MHLSRRFEQPRGRWLAASAALVVPVRDGLFCQAQAVELALNR